MRSITKIMKSFRKLDNRGFSLLELLVSIVILVLIMIPLMNNFFRSMKINEEAASLQDYSNVAANLVENMKSMDLDQTLVQYQANRLQSNPDGTFSLYGGTPAKGNYYFGLENIQEGASYYDALITISAKAYQYNGSEHNGTLMNNYKMPDIVTVDSNLNGMFFSTMYKDTATNALANSDDPMKTTDKNLDQMVLEYFTSLGEQYADEQFKANSAAYAEYLQKLRAYQNGETTIVPIEPSRFVDPVYANPSYCNPDDISDWITKSADIQMDAVEVSTDVYATVINYQIAYHCSWPTGLSIDSDITYTIENKNYATLINNVYLYYLSSIFQQNDLLHPDSITITNNSGKAANFFIVKQSSDMTNSSISFTRNGIDPINIYTNLADDKVDELGVDASSEVIHNEIIASTAKDRIYSITVQIYKHADGTPETKYQSQDVLYTLTSNRDK